MKKIISSILVAVVVITGVCMNGGDVVSAEEVANVEATATEAPEPCKIEAKVAMADKWVSLGKNGYGTKGYIEPEKAVASSHVQMQSITCKNGQTINVTKGFKVTLDLELERDATWKSEKSQIATVETVKKKGVVTARKKGKTTVTAYYGGQKSYVTINVVDNKMKRKLLIKETSSKKSTSKSGCGITEAHFDSKGNLSCTFSSYEKPLSVWRKRVKSTKPSYVVIESAEGKTMAKKKINLKWKNAKGKVKKTKFKIEKKYFKTSKNNIDLRTSVIGFKSGSFIMPYPDNAGIS